MKQANESNKLLIEKLAGAQTGQLSLERDKAITQSIKISKSAVQIQRLARGFIARKRLVKKMRELKTRPMAKSSGGSSQFLEQCLSKLEKRGFNFECLFRIADAETKFRISSEEFRAVLKKMKAFSDFEVNRIRYLFDEESRGELVYEDYLTIISVHGLSREPRTDQVAAKYKEEVIKRFLQFSEGERFEQEQLSYLDFSAMLEKIGEANSHFFSEAEKVALI